MKHYKYDPDIKTNINASVTTELATLRAEVERLRCLIARYSMHVVHNEGTDFLADVHFTGEITKKEMSEICEYQEALK